MCCKDLFLLLWYFYCCISWSKCCLPMQDICLHLPWCTFLIAVDISSVDDGFIVGCWRLMFTCRYFSLYILNKRFLVFQFISISPAICIHTKLPFCSRQSLFIATVITRSFCQTLFEIYIHKIFHLNALRHCKQCYQT